MRAGQIDNAALTEQHQSFLVRPDDVVHLRAHLLPLEVLSAQAVL